MPLMFTFLAVPLLIDDRTNDWTRQEVASDNVAQLRTRSAFPRRAVNPHEAVSIGSNPVRIWGKLVPTESQFETAHIPDSHRTRKRWRRRQRSWRLAIGDFTTIFRQIRFFGRSDCVDRELSHPKKNSTIFTTFTRSGLGVGNAKATKNKKKNKTWK